MKEMKGNQCRKGQNERKWRPNGPKRKKWSFKRQILEKEKLQNLKGKWQFWAKSWPDGLFRRLKRPKWKKWRPKRPKWKEMKAQKAKMKGNESPKGQNERPMKAQKAQRKGNEGPKDQNERKREPQKAKFLKGSEGPNCQNLKGKWQVWAKSWPDPFGRKSKCKWPNFGKGNEGRKRPKWKEMKAQFWARSC